MTTIALLIVLVVCGVVWYGTTQFPEIGPMGRFIRFVVVVVAIICTLLWLLALLGVASPVHAHLP